MKLVSRAAGVAISATAMIAALAPAAAADSSRWEQRGLLRVCALGLDRGDEAEVEVEGRRADREAEFRGCATWRLPAGTYHVSVDAPRNYEISDDDATVKVYPGSRTTVHFWFEEDDHFDPDTYDGYPHWR